MILDNLIGAWEFNGNADDTSGNGNHGTVSGASLAADRFGNVQSAYAFDGDDHIRVADNPVLRPTAAMSATLWMKADALPGSFQVTHFLHKQEFAGGNDYPGYWMRMDNNSSQCPGQYTVNGGVNVAGARRGDFACIDGTALTDWRFLAMTYDGTSTRFYVDAVLVAEDIFSGTIEHSSMDLLIGSGPNVSTTAFTGTIDDVYLYSDALTESELSALYTATAVPGPALAVIFMLGIVAVLRNRRQSAFSPSPRQPRLRPSCARFRPAVP